MIQKNSVGEYYRHIYYIHALPDSPSLKDEPHNNRLTKGRILKSCPDEFFNSRINNLFTSEKMGDYGK